MGHNLEMAYHILFFLPTASLIGDVYIKLTEVVSSLDVFYSYVSVKSKLQHAPLGNPPGI